MIRLACFFFVFFASFMAWCQESEGVIPSGVKVAKIKECGSEVRTDDGILLPIIKRKISYPDVLDGEISDVLWVLIRFDVGKDYSPININAEGDFPSSFKEQFEREFSLWKFPPCVNKGKLVVIEDEKILLRLSK